MTATDDAARADGPKKAAAPFRIPHAVVMMLLIILTTVGLTYVIPSGSFDRNSEGLVKPGTFHSVAKDYDPRDILTARKSTPELAYPASPLAVFTSIPVGMNASASLIFMIMFIGGMFGVLQETGALNAGIERLLAALSLTAISIAVMIGY
jgi:uncharacterized ion transporter superfamily protein YfcC